MIADKKSQKEIKMKLDLTPTERKIYEEAIAKYPDATAEIEQEIEEMVATRLRVAQAQHFVPINRYNLPRCTTKRAR